MTYLTSDLAESTTHHQLVVGLNGQCKDEIIRIGVERRIQCVISIEAGN